MRSNDAASMTPHAHALASEPNDFGNARLRLTMYGTAPSADAHAIAVVSTSTVKAETRVDASPASPAMPSRSGSASASMRVELCGCARRLVEHETNAVSMNH